MPPTVGHFMQSYVIIFRNLEATQKVTRLKVMEIKTITKKDDMQQ